MLDLDTALPQIDVKAACADYDRYLRENSIERLKRALSDIEGAAQEVDLAETGGARAAARAIQALSDGTPLSLIRIGDGEGNLLGALKPDFTAARHFSARTILDMMFGAADFTAREIQRIGQDMAASVATADVLGVSDHVRIGRLQTLRQTPHSHEDVRGHMGSYESIFQVASLLASTRSRPPLLVSNHVHRYMMRDLPSVIAAAREVTLIGPYDLQGAFAEALGCSGVRVCLIPNQASSTPGEGSKWYPDHYHTVRDRMRVSPGSLFLVSAGVLGKALCAIVKARGGVALDIGSAVDVWAGKPVRKYHDAHFLARYRLTRPSDE